MSRGSLRTRTWWCVSHQGSESELMTRVRPKFRAKRLGVECRHLELGTGGQIPRQTCCVAGACWQVQAGLGPELRRGLETDA